MANKFEVVKSPDEAEDAAAFVCVRLTDPLKFPDNLIDVCSKCGTAIQHRPHFPKKPPKVCMECAMDGLIEAEKKGKLHIQVTEKTAEEVIEVLRKKDMH